MHPYLITRNMIKEGNLEEMNGPANTVHTAHWGSHLIETPGNKVT